jgi:hypothetical protein
MNQLRMFMIVAAIALAVVAGGCAGGANDEAGSSGTNQAPGANSLVTLDPSNGTGFVGKGDVQLAFGWNNAQLQKNAGGLSFTYATEDSYSAVCEWITGEGTRGQKTHDVTHVRTSSVTSQIAYDARVRTQITGFMLRGIESTTEEGSVPEVDGQCPGNEGTDGVWVSVEQTGSSGGLYVNFGGNSVLIWE